jgi:hypothetical protein
MATEQLAVGLSKVHDRRSVVVIERILARLDRIPLHAVFRGELAKVGLEDVLRRAIRQRPGVANVAIVLLACPLEERVDTLRGLAFQNVCRVVRDGCCRGDSREKGKRCNGKLHFDGSLNSGSKGKLTTRMRTTKH